MHWNSVAASALLILSGLQATGASAREASRDVARFMNHLEIVVPELLEVSSVPGAAVALVHDGRVVYVSGFGWADAERRERARPDTVFNVGSISKTLTAWGVVRLVEKGDLRLEDSLAGLLGEWPLTDGSSGDGVTIARLLNHSSGVSAPSVPEYLPWEAVPSLETWLGSPDNVRLAASPGENWSYSGAGYSLLQLAIERASGQTFEEFMQQSILGPLGMSASTFSPPRGAVAQPHAEGRPIPYRRYAGLAAAGLYASAEDLARFLAAHSGGAATAPGRGVLAPASVAAMRSPTEISRSLYNTAYGMGYSIWPLADGTETAGHRGQNHGWSAVAWLSADGRDGLAILTNDSHGESLYRWVFCDWAHWLSGERSFGGYCAARNEHPGGRLFTEADRGRADLVAELRSRVGTGGPGVAALVARGNQILLRDAVGQADVETGLALTATTPFYIASVAKPMTATVVLDLVAQGRLALDDPINAILPEFPSFGRRITVRQLLEHSSGTPDFWALYDWSRPAPLSNEAVFALVRDAGTAKFASGVQFDYNNTGYLGLATLAEAVTGRPFADLLIRRVSQPPSTSGLVVLDDPVVDLPQRARGYGMRDGALRLVDYRRLELPGLRPLEPAFSTVGAGGVVANVDGLFAFARGLLDGELLPSDLVRLLFEPGRPAEGIEGFDGTPLAGLGFVVSDFGGYRLAWQDGNLFGHRSLLVIEPESETVVVLLANSSEIELEPIARALLERVLRLS